MGLININKENNCLPELPKEVIKEFEDKRKEHLRNANALVSKFKTGISNSDAEDILKILYHKVIANVLLPQKRNSALDYLSSKEQEISENIIVRRQLLGKIDKELVRISNLSMKPTYDEIKAFCKDDCILYWFEHSPHCWQGEHSFWSVRDVVGSMKAIIKLIESDFVENGKPTTFSEYIAYGEFPVILEQVI